MERSLTRKDFLVGTIAAGAALLAESCGNDDIGDGPGASASTGSDGWAPTGGPGNGSSSGGNGNGSGGAPSGSSTTGGNGGAPSTENGGAGGVGGSSSASTGGGSSACSTTVKVEITCNHGHYLYEEGDAQAEAAFLADIAAGTSKTYNIKGSSSHPHNVTITAADFETLERGGTIFKFADGGQDHCLVISCATPGNPANSACDMGNALEC